MKYFFCTWKNGLNKRFSRALGFGLPAVLASLILRGPDSAHAQSSTGSDQFSILQQLNQSGVQGNSSAITGIPGSSLLPVPSDMTFQPAMPGTQAPLPPSRLEQILSGRAGVKLEQFGYDQLGRGRAVTIPQTGAVQDDYVLGPGDEIVVDLRGQENSSFRVIVDRNGRVVLPRLSPIAATGRTFGTFRQDLESAVRRAFIATNAFVSVGRVRQISVLVSGEVNVPGQRIVSGLSSAVDALVLSGGVKKTGSLRNVRVERGGRTVVVDLYGVLTNTGGTNDLRLADGDRILVPPLTKTVAVSGLVRQPGIYELPAQASDITARALLALAGGLEIRGRYRLSVLRITANGSSQMVALPDENGAVGDSEILFAQLGANQTVGQATLSGGAALAGQYPITEGTKLSDFLKAPGALPAAPYTLFGIIARKDPRTLLRSLLAITPVAVLSGYEDQPLQSDDIIRVLSVDEARILTNTVRLYNERQAQEQAAIRNPLDEPDSSSLPNGGNTPAAVSRNAGGTQTAQNLIVGQNQSSAISTLDLAEMQRRDIAELANQIDPVTRQNLAAQAQAEQDQIAQQQLASRQTNPQLYGVASPVPSSQADQSRDTMAPSSTAVVAASGVSSIPGVIQPPAANFESTDATSGHIPSNREISNFGDLARQLGVDQLVLVNFLSDHRAVLDGAVGGPGSYFVGPNVALQDLVQAAGGTVNWADESGVELISTIVDNQAGHSATQRVQLPLRQGMLANYIVHPRDEFRFNQIFSDAGLGTATVQGEVRFSGSYQITRGEHLSSLLARAGGLTNTAYPYGTVFLRKSAAATERTGYIRAAEEIEEELVVAMTRIGNDKIDPNTFASLQTFVTELRNQKAVGRIAIAADPSVLASRPELDPLLEPGDIVYIPPRPSTISVLGQVMQPGSLPFRSGSTMQDYIQMAGGYSATSDSSNTFVVMPDGSARRIEQSWFDFSPTDLPPGATIVVPRDVTPLDTRQLILDITGIFSQLAVSAASLAVLSKQ